MIQYSRLVTITILSGCFFLQGCNNVKKTLGIDKAPPDEFAVTPSNPSLDMPPDFFVLPLPEPGVPRPQEVNEMDARKEKLLGGGTQKGAASPAQEALLEMAGSERNPNDIRRQVDEDSHIERAKGRPWLEQLGLKKQQQEVVDPMEETVRLEKEGISKAHLPSLPPESSIR